MSGSIRGNFFEDLAPGRVFRHAIPRTITYGDISTYIALTGDRRPLYCSRDFATGLGLPDMPVNDLLVFHMVFGRTVADISLNSPANLGYADVRFTRPVYVGDTLRAETEVIGWRETSRPDIGIVWVHSRGYNQRDETVLQYYRWVMVRKRDPDTSSGADDAPELPDHVAPEHLAAPPGLDGLKLDATATGGAAFWEDYGPGQRIVHPYGQTVEEAEHQMAARLYHNMARAHHQLKPRTGTVYDQRIVYGGHVISLAHTLSYDGLENALCILAFNGGTHANPTFAGDTLYAWTEVLERIDLGRPDVGALRLRLVAVKNIDPGEEPVELKVADEKTGRERYHSNVTLDLDYTALVARRK